MRELALGLRLAVSGGRSARLRAVMTAVGVGLGMVVLLFAAAVPSMIHEGDQRSADRDGVPAERRGPATVLSGYADTTFREDGIRGRVLQAEGPRAAPPPGLRDFPAPGALVVSPALGDLLRSDGGALLRERLGGRIAGEIGDAGLRGPRELVFYRGARPGELDVDNAERFGAWGVGVNSDGMPLILDLIVAVGAVVLLLPVAVFIGTAVRFGSDERDRRLAALRLVGADRAMAARIAAGEALLGVLGGLGLGGLLFAALRPLVERFELQDISVFAADVQPRPALVALILAGVPVAAVAASVLALRRVVVEPLGVVRRGPDARRRLWWRVAPLPLGAALLAQLGPRDMVDGSDASTAQVSVGVVLMLVGLTAVLPWVVDAVLRRTRGGSVAAQLAIRRMQMDGGTAARVVSGVAVAVAGAIALQSILSAGQEASTRSTGADLSRADASVFVPTDDRAALLRRLAATPGVGGATAVAQSYTRGTAAIRVGDCAALREYARLRRCRDGDAFVTSHGPPPGRAVRVGRQTYTVPADARRVFTRLAPNGSQDEAVLLTPSAAAGAPVEEVEAFVRFDGTPDAAEHLRNAFPAGYAEPLRTTTELGAYRTVKRALYAGAVAILILIGASLLVGGLEQLRERRPVLAALSAFGAPRGTLALSVLWQAAIPVVLGLVVANGVGLGLAALLLSVAEQRLAIDWLAVAGMSAAGGGVILAVTALTLPAVRRLMRPEGLRTE